MGINNLGFVQLLVLVLIICFCLLIAYVILDRICRCIEVCSDNKKGSKKNGVKRQIDND